MIAIFVRENGGRVVSDNVMSVLYIAESEEYEVYFEDVDMEPMVLCARAYSYVLKKDGVIVDWKWGRDNTFNREQHHLKVHSAAQKAGVVMMPAFEANPFPFAFMSKKKEDNVRK